MFLTNTLEYISWPFSNTPREVQLDALKKLFGLPGAAYFMRQRLGKTWTAYAEFCLLRQHKKCDWFVLICPNSLKQQWKDAIEQVEEFEPVCVYGSNQKSRVEYFFEHNDKGGAFIINYESVATFMKSDIYASLDKSRVYICADESTKIKDPGNKTTKACIDFAEGCAYRRVLTGRPTANNNLDIWAQLKFIGCTVRNFYQHRHTFCVMGGFQGRQIMKNINLALLQKELEPISYIAEDKYVKGFEKIYEPMRIVRLSGRLAELYKKMQDELIFNATDDVNITAPIMLTKYLRLQQIGSGIAGDPDGEQHNLVEPHFNPRISVVKEILSNEITNKVIIVCRFKLSILNLYNELTRDGYKCGVLAGGMKSEHIEKAKKDFNDGDHDILIAQTQVLSFGHTLCGNDAKPCDSIIFYENDFSLINRTQCESRPEKMGRDIAISYYDLYASKMDRYILDKLIAKEEASLALMNYARTNGMRPEGLNSDKEVDKEFAM